MPVLEVFADVACPFTHVGLLRFVEARADRGRTDVLLRVRAWPLELVNGEPLQADVVAEEVHELRTQVSADLFVGFDQRRFPATSVPAMALAAAAYGRGDAAGEAVSLGLRWALFEEGRDVADADVLAAVAPAAGLQGLEPDRGSVDADLAEGRARGVVGSPHFFVGDEGWFCPGLDIERRDGSLRIERSAGEFERFLATALD